MQTILQQIKDVVRKADPTAEVILFGSRARGDFRPDSDWDVLIVTEKEINNDYEEKMLHALLALEMELGICINYFFRSKKAWESPTAIPLYNEIKKEGIKL